jgi:pyruvate dehydrogenase (quinone)
MGSTAQLPYVLDIAVRTAMEQRDVAVLVVPGDILAHEIDRPNGVATIRPTCPQVRPSEVELDRATDVLNDARRVTILAGAGCVDARTEVLALAATLQAPIVHSLRGKEIVEYDNPYDVGMTGLLGFSSGYQAMERCDTLLMLGTDFPYRQFYPRHATVLQVDLRGEHIGRRTRVDVPLVGTVKDTAAALLSRVKPKTDAEHLEQTRSHYATARQHLDDFAVDDHNRTPLHPQFVARTIDELAADDAVFLPDVGTPVVWAARYLRMNGKRRLIGSFNHGTMANALPQAIGVQAAHADRQVVTLSGDGGLAMLFGELITLRQLKLPVKIVVFNNGALGFVELEMKAAGLVNFGTELEDPDFAGVASALGLYGQRVERPEDLPGALRAAFGHKGPALIDVLTARQELSIPPTITFEQVKGFTLYATRTLLSGRGDELIDLAETNVARHLLSGRH